MNPRHVFKPFLAATVVLALAACGGPSQEPVAAPEPQPSQPQEQARDDATDGESALRAPSRPEDDARQPRELEGAPASPAGDPEGAGASSTAAGGGFAPGHAVPDQARPVLGEWVVAGHRFGAIAALDDTGAARLHGREVSYGDAHANSGADSCGAPRYHVAQRNVVETLLADYRTSPIALGLDQGAGAQVTVIEVECTPPWVTLGSHLLVMPDGLVLAPWDGVFFELRRR